MVTFKLIKLYPGSHELGVKIKPQIKQDQDNTNNYYVCGNWINPREFPEHWEEVKELTLLEEARLRYPAGTKFIPTARPSRDTNTSIGNFRDNGEFIVCSQTSVSIYNKTSKKWAEIVDDFVLPKKWCIYVDLTNVDFINKVRDRALSYDTFITSYLLTIDNKNSWMAKQNAKKEGFTEITFEQFKKYVLKKEVVTEVKEVVEKDYEILSFTSSTGQGFVNKGAVINKNNNGLFGYKTVNDWSENFLLSINHITIHSIKRLNDGEIFTIGDRCRNGVIESFKQINGDCPFSAVYNHKGHDYINQLVKSKIPLFTTEDGIDIFEGSDFYSTRKDGSGIVIKYNGNHLEPASKKCKDFVDFSTRKKAEEYILMNKPCLSFSDIYDNLKIKDREFVLKFIKSKIK